MSKLRKVAVMGFYGKGNAGDEALLSSILLGLESCEKIVSVIVLSSDPSHTRHEHQVEAVHNYIPTSLKELIIRLIGRNRTNFIKSLCATFKCNTLIIGGGGLFFDQPGNNYHFAKLLRAIRLFEALGKEVYMVGVSIDRLYVPSSTKNLRAVLNHEKMKAIIARDKKSASDFEKNSVRKNICFSTEDIAFCLQPTTEPFDNSDALTQYVEKNVKNIGLALCGYKLTADHKYRQEIRKTVSHLVSLDYNLVAIPMSVGSDNDREGMVHALAGLDLEGPGTIKCVEENLTVRQNISLFSMMDCVIAERLHASILCIIGNTPIIGISYAAKVHQMYKSIDREDWQKSSVSLDHKWLQRRVGYSLDNQRKIKKELEVIAHEKRCGAAETFVILNSLLSK